MYPLFHTKAASTVPASRYTTAKTEAIVSSPSRRNVVISPIPRAINAAAARAGPTLGILTPRIPDLKAKNNRRARSPPARIPISNASGGRNPVSGRKGRDALEGAAVATGETTPSVETGSADEPIPSTEEIVDGIAVAAGTGVTGVVTGDIGAVGAEVADRAV